VDARPTREERAAWALSKACNGWRHHGQCIDSRTRQPLDQPHPGCQRAQLEHDLILGEHDGHPSSMEREQSAQRRPR